MILTIDFSGAELCVSFDVSCAEPDVGLRQGIEIYLVEYGDCNITDLIHCLDLMEKLTEKTYEKLEDVK